MNGHKVELEAEAPSPPKEKVKEKKIPLVEMFGPTVQGEGAVIGLQTYFLRFGLCDYACAMCDSMHAVDPVQVKANAEWLTNTEIYEGFRAFYQEHTTNWVTFSGGNPCIHDLSQLVESLNNSRFNISVETQGTFCPEWLWHCQTISVSPKGPGMGEKLEIDKLDQFIRQMREHPGVYIKVVIFDQRDIEVASMLFERYCSPKFEGRCLSPSQFYLSLGNPYHSGVGASLNQELLSQELLGRYRNLLEDVMRDKNLCRVRFLPQLHTLLWGNSKGV